MNGNKTDYFCENLVIIRGVWSMTLLEISEMYGITKNRYHSYERGANKADIYFYLSVEEKTGIEVRRLVYEKISRLDIPDRPYKRDKDGNLYYINDKNERIQKQYQDMQNGNQEIAKVLLAIQKELDDMKKRLAQVEKDKEDKKKS